MPQEKSEIRVSAAERGPGPGHYGLPSTLGHTGSDPTKRKSPGYSFGQKIPVKYDSTPGPVYFIDPGITRSGSNGNPRYSMNGRHADKKIQHTPGPGAYSTENVKPTRERNAPVFSLGMRTRCRPTDKVPAANTYTIPSTLGPKVPYARGAPSFSFSPQSTFSSYAYDMAKTPGPAHYNPVNPSANKRRPAEYTLKGRTVMPGDKTQKPGPGAHNPERVNAHLRSGPRFSMGTRHSEFVMPVITLADVSD